MPRSRRPLVSMRKGLRLPSFPSLVLTLIGVVVGFAVTMCLQALNALPNPSPGLCLLSQTPEPIHRWTLNPPDQNQILVGIMTAQKYVDTRAWTVWRTWVQNFPGTVIFFAPENTVCEHPELPLVRLDGVDDSYPPQKKSFMMLRWMAKHGLDRFEWFVRADDDVYIRGDRLEIFLRSLNSSRAYFLGQAGLGTPEEYGMLSLGEADNYCMGGPGVILSRQTLRLVSPRIAQCLRNMYTTHEDVEVGRCVRKFAGVSCSWSYEMQSVFYNNQSGTSAYTGDLNVAEVHQAISLHPVKRPQVMQRLHNYIRKLKTGDLRFRAIQLSRDVLASLTVLASSGDPVHRSLLDSYSDFGLAPSLMRFVPSSTEAVLEWDLVSPSLLYCAGRPNCPRHNAESYLRYAQSDIIRQLMDIMNRQARQRGRILDFQSLLYGYRRVDPVHGAEYVLDVLLLYKKFKGRRVTVPVRRHAYVQQSFAALELRDSPRPTNQRIYFIVPLSGRQEAFHRFISIFEETCLGNPAAQVSLLMVLFRSSSPDRDEQIRSTLEELGARYGREMVDWVEVGARAFSRGLALARGAASLPADSLLFLTDIDVVFSNDALQRIRLNTIQGVQVFFPIVFSEFAPEFRDQASGSDSHFVYDSRRGYFRHFGFGLASLFKSDLDLVGGLETGIQGWGLEDVNLFEKCLRNEELSVLRGPEPGLVHVYHPVICDRNLSAAQYEMCLGSRVANFASVDSLADRVLSNPNYAHLFSNDTS